MSPLIALEDALEDVREKAHRLRGSSSLFGTNGLERQLRRIELGVRESNTILLDDVAELPLHLDRLLKQIDELWSRRPDVLPEVNHETSA